MSVRDYLDSQPLKDLIPYDSTVDLPRECIAFSGAPRKHPYDDSKLLLIIDPFSKHTAFYEFRISDISAVEDLPSIGTDSGENLTMVRIWVRRGSLGVRFEPFEVDDPLRFYEDATGRVSTGVESPQ